MHFKPRRVYAMFSKHFSSNIYSNIYGKCIYSEGDIFDIIVCSSV